MVKLHAPAGSTARRVMSGGAAVAAVLGLAACGTVTAKNGGQAGASGAPASTSPRATTGPVQGSVPVGTGPALCAGVSQLRSLTVTRVVTLPNHLRFTFPARVRVTAPVRVRAVATAACQSPQMPRVMMTCPADFGVSYRLAFATAGRAYPDVTAAATGCAKLAGLESIRQAQPGFWVILGRAMGVAAPDSQAFTGHHS